jgi:hypothetical protein
MTRVSDVISPDLVTAPSAEKIAAAEAVMTELEMLREFFDCWEGLHKLARQSAIPRWAKENAAQRLVDAAETIRAFRQPVQPERPKLEVVR